MMSGFQLTSMILTSCQTDSVQSSHCRETILLRALVSWLEQQSFRQGGGGLPVPHPRSRVDADEQGQATGLTEFHGWSMPTCAPV